MTLDEKRTVRISKLLSLALRHDPSALGITLDSAGWTDVSSVLNGLATKANEVIDADDLEEIVATSDKQRFALSPDGTRIRANQGHSIEGVDLGLPPRAPPPTLYHGTVQRFVGSIMREGILRRARTHVHLSAETDTAQVVAGRRKGDKAILRIRAIEMHEAGYLFFCSENNVWLTERVPPEFIEPIGEKPIDPI